MGREILVEESVRDSLIHDHNGHEEIGLIIGAYPSNPTGPISILYLSPTKSEDESAQPTLNSPNLKQLNHHTKQTLRMLPGGLNILGLYFISNEKITNKENLKTLLNSVKKQLGRNPFNYAEELKEKIVFCYEPKTCKFDVKLFDSESETKCETSFGKNFFDKIETRFDLSGGGLIYGSNIKEAIKCFLGLWQETLKSSKILLNGKVAVETENYTGQESISILIEKVPLMNKNGLKNKDFVNHLHLQGYIQAIGFVQSHSNQVVAVQTLERDILRSLSSRLEMHCESLIDFEEDGNESQTSNRTFHEIPRRVFANLLKADQGLLVCDFLFSGEGAKDSVNSFMEILNLDLDESDVDLSKEIGFSDTEKCSNMSSPILKASSMEELFSKAESISKLSPGIVTNNKKTVFWIFSLAFVFGLVALLYPNFYNRVF